MLREKGQFVNGEKDGKWIWYDEFGKEGVVAQFVGGKMTSMKDNIPATKPKARNR